MPQPFQWLTGLSYGPVVGETSKATNYGPFGNKLGTSDVAASANIIAQHPYFSTFNYNGKTYTIADTSYNSRGPTNNTLEFRDTADNQSINPADISWDPSSGGIMGKIAARLPGGRAYLAGQAIYNAVKDARNRAAFFKPGPDSDYNNMDLGIDVPLNQGQGIPDDLQPVTPPYNSPPGFGFDAASDPNAPKPFNPPPWVMPPPSPIYGMHPAGSGVDPGYVDPRSANSFISALIDWNGPGAPNPSSREGFNPHALGANPMLGALATRFGLSGRASSSGGGRLPVNFQ